MSFKHSSISGSNHQHCCAACGRCLCCCGLESFELLTSLSLPSSPSSPQGVLVWRGGSGNQLAHPGAGVGRLSGKCLSPSERRPRCCCCCSKVPTLRSLQLITATHRRTSRISDLARLKGIVHLKKNLISHVFS